MQHRRGFADLCVHLFARACTPHPKLHCDSPLLPDMQQCAQTHTAEQRRSGSAYQSERERDRRRVRQEGRPESEARRERGREGVHVKQRQRARDKREETPFLLLLSPSLLVFTSAVSLSSCLAEWATALQFLQRDSPSQAFPAERGGGRGNRRSRGRGAGEGR